MHRPTRRGELQKYLRRNAFVEPPEPKGGKPKPHAVPEPQECHSPIRGPERMRRVEVMLTALHEAFPAPPSPEQTNGLDQEALRARRKRREAQARALAERIEERVARRVATRSEFMRAVESEMRRAAVCVELRAQEPSSAASLHSAGEAQDSMAILLEEEQQRASRAVSSLLGRATLALARRVAHVGPLVICVAWWSKVSELTRT